MRRVDDDVHRAQHLALPPPHPPPRPAMLARQPSQPCPVTRCDRPAPGARRPQRTRTHRRTCAQTRRGQRGAAGGSGGRLCEAPYVQLVDLEHPRDLPQPRLQPPHLAREKRHAISREPRQRLQPPHLPPTPSPPPRRHPSRHGLGRPLAVPRESRPRIRPPGSPAANGLVAARPRFPALLRHVRPHGRARLPGGFGGCLVTGTAARAAVFDSKELTN